MTVKLMNTIARETHGKSCGTLGIRLDDVGTDDNEVLSVWQSSAESSHKGKYISLEALAKSLALSDEQILTYFLDGSRRVFKPSEIAYEYSGGRRGVYPVMAGQIAVGCCRRGHRKLVPEKLKYEIVIALPESADYDDNAKRGFWEGLRCKFSAQLEPLGLEVAKVLPYKTGRDSRNTSFEDRGTAAIQSRMLECEREITEYLVRRKLLSHKNYLVKDGSLEYWKKSGLPSQNYRWVIGLSKSFNPEACTDIHGKPDPGYIADLPVNHRTQAARYMNSSFFGEARFAVWYIRLHDRRRMRSAFDGIVKAEKMLVTREEIDSGFMDSSEIDTLSAYILNERCPVCYGSDSRWTSHIYPVYLTESCIKSKYISTESFLNLF